MFINISGAYFNPAVVLCDLINKRIELKIALLFIFIQIIGGIFGCLLANFYFDKDILEWSTNERYSFLTFISEIVATFGLILTIIIISNKDKDKIAIAVALYITAGYWFTSSTSFANPAVTVSRIFTDSFTGIYPYHAFYFIFAQIIGAFIATFFAKLFISSKNI
jgi:glycerol uptake facilitator-like aquaporin